MTVLRSKSCEDGSFLSFLQHKAPSPCGEGAFIRACIILCYLLIVKLESEGQVSPNALVINLAVQFAFGVVVNYSTNDVFSEV